MLQPTAHNFHLNCCLKRNNFKEKLRNLRLSPNTLLLALDDGDETDEETAAGAELGERSV